MSNAMAAALPEGISDALRAGIAKYYEQIDALGGCGSRIEAVMSDGSVRVGTLAECGFGGCQPALATADGKMYRLTSLADVSRAGVTEAHA